MPAETLLAPELEKRGIETHGIERVSPDKRTHVRIFDNFTMWLSANLVISTVSLGMLSRVLFSLGFWDSFAIIVLFNALGVLPVAFFSTLGPRLGLRQMTISRFSFGWVGGIIMAIFNVAACIGWSAVNVVIGGQLVAALSSGAIPSWVGVIIIAVLTTLVSIYGYKYVHRYERYAWIPMAIMFLVIAVVQWPHMHIVPTPAVGAAEIAGMVSFGGAVYGFATGWSSYAADYNVNQPENTPVSRVFWLTFLGVFIPCVVLETLGLALTTAPALANLSGGSLLAAAVKPLGIVGTIIVALLALSVIANNIPNDYSLGLSVQVLGPAFQRVNRAIWTFIGAIIYIVIALLVGGSFNETLQSFLLIVAYWLGPWSIILILEHFVFRRGRYNVEDWNTPRKLPLGWAAIVSLFIGLVGVVLGAAQAIVLNNGKTVIPVVGPIAHLVNPPYGMDVGFELGVIFAAIAYLILRRVELSRSER
jgi:NCS1 nucleoside transporter family